MKYRLILSALTAGALLLSGNLAVGADSKAAAPQQAASKTKAGASVKLVDINSASSDELKKLPGIGDAEAAKIIAGRPYGSKSWLVGHKILAQDKYPAIRNLIIAKQPGKDAAKNAALLGKKK
jgi:hypothetical protein